MLCLSAVLIHVLAIVRVRLRGCVCLHPSFPVVVSGVGHTTGAAWRPRCRERQYVPTAPVRPSVTFHALRSTMGLHVRPTPPRKKPFGLGALRGPRPHLQTAAVAVLGKSRGHPP